MYWSPPSLPRAHVFYLLGPPPRLNLGGGHRRALLGLCAVTEPNSPKQFSQQVWLIGIKTQCVRTHTASEGGLIRQVKAAAWEDRDALNVNQSVAWLHLRNTSCWWRLLSPIYERRDRSIFYSFWLLWLSVQEFSTFTTLLKKFFLTFFFFNFFLTFFFIWFTWSHCHFFFFLQTPKKVLRHFFKVLPVFVAVRHY